MAKSAKKATQKAPDNVVGTQTAEAPKETTPKKMTKESAQAIVDKYAGINGVNISELAEAKKFLKENK